MASQPQWRVQGHYSVSKLDAYQAYRQCTSTRRVLLEVLVAPLPSLAINLLLEAIPLADPALGWHYSAPFFARFFLTAMITSMPPIVIKGEYIPEFPVTSWRQIVLNGLVQSVVGMAVCVGIIAASGVFPFPFLQFVPILPMTLVGKMSAFSAHFENRPDIGKRERGVNNLLAIEQMPVIIYPMFAALFMVVSPTMQLWLSAALPLLKFAVRSALARAGWFDTDLLGVITCAAGHLYHVLFVAMCLQNSKSWDTMTIIAAFNTLQMIFNAHEIMGAAARVHQSFDQVRASSFHSDRSAQSLDRTCSAHCAHDFITTALAFAVDVNVGVALHTNTPQVFLSTFQRYRRPEFVAQSDPILLFEPKPLLLSRQPRRFFLSVRSTRTVTSSISSRRQSWLRRPTATVQVRPVVQRLSGWRRKLVRVRPLPRNWANRRHASSRSLDLLTSEQKLQKVFVLELCAALHQTEMIVLRSYITISMLLFYGASLLETQHLWRWSHLFIRLVLQWCTWSSCFGCRTASSLLRWNPWQRCRRSARPFLAYCACVLSSAASSSSIWHY
jgi:hypothetical protein